MGSGYRPTCAELTGYPDLYRGVYWGAFRSRPEEAAAARSIIRNRDRFAASRKLKRVTDLPSQVEDVFRRRWRSTWDHLEVYITDSGKIVLVVSPYDVDREGRSPARLDPLFEAIGFKRTRKLYSKGTTSYAATFHTRRELKLAAKMISARITRETFPWYGSFYGGEQARLTGSFRRYESLLIAGREMA